MPKRLFRDTRRGIIGGVAAGFGQYLEVDPVLVRLAFVVLAFAQGVGLLAYLVCWLIIPRAEVPETAGPAAGTGFDNVREAGARLAAEVRSAAEGGVRSAAESVGVGPADASKAQAVVGSFLIVSGAVLLAHNLGWLEWPEWASFETLWPLLLVALGVGLILRSRRRSATA